MVKMKSNVACRYCGRELEGIFPCGCKESHENSKMWSSAIGRHRMDVTKINKIISAGEEAKKLCEILLDKMESGRCYKNKELSHLVGLRRDELKYLKTMKILIQKGKIIFVKKLGKDLIYKKT